MGLLTPEQKEAIENYNEVVEAHAAALAREAKDLAAKAEEKADSLLAKVTKSRYTWLILLGVVLAGVALFLLG